MIFVLQLFARISNIRHSYIQMCYAFRILCGMLLYNANQNVKETSVWSVETEHRSIIAFLLQI